MSAIDWAGFVWGLSVVINSTLPTPEYAYKLYTESLFSIGVYFALRALSLWVVGHGLATLVGG